MAGTAVRSALRPRPLEPRRSPVRDAAVVLVTIAVVGALLDSEGLVTWARRQDVGPVQSGLMAVLEPLDHALGSVGLGTPRRWLAAHAPSGAMDSVLAKGWTRKSRFIALTPVGDEAVVEPEVVQAPVGHEPGVLLLGDSMMAGSLGSALERAAKRTGLPVVRVSQLGTGLARPDVYDWMAVVPELIARERPRAVVVALGANDGTNLREGEEQLDYGEARWKQVYTARVEAMMRTLAGKDTRVLWLSLPPMRDRRLNARALSLNRLFAQCARRVPRVEVLELDVLLGDEDRRYATFVDGPDGKQVRYRLDDGVHLAPAGARAVATWVRDWLRGT